MADIDSLNIQIKTESDSAVKGLENLRQTLQKLANATKNGLGLSSITSELSDLAKKADTLTGTKTQNIKSFAEALSSLSTISDVKISSSIANQFENIVPIVNSINANNISSLSTLATALSSLSGLNEVHISSTIATQLKAISEAISTIQETDYSAITELATGLQPLATLGNTTNFDSTVNHLKTLIDTVSNLNSESLQAFSANVQSLVSGLTPLTTIVSSISSSFEEMFQNTENADTALQSMTTTSQNSLNTYTELWSRLKILGTALKGIITTIMSWVEESNSYVESLNLFTASMGEYAEEAQEYAEEVANVMGIDTSDWMEAQGVFMTLAEGFGVASDRAYIMSQQLTQLGYDLSSFFNISVDEAMQKLQSGLSGELEPLRRLGYDLSEARLQAIALELGISEAYSEMTQAEKSQLRYYAIMTQVTTAQGDMARTLSAPANQLRILKAQVTQAARALGNIFIPVLNKVIPVCIAVFKAIRMVAAAIASLFGYTLPEVDYSSITSSISSTTDATDDLSDSLDSAGSSASDALDCLMGFDEINQLADESSSGGSGGSGSGISSDDYDWDWDLPTYDFLANLVESTVDEIYAKIEPIVEWIEEHLEGILDIALAIGASMAMWKIASTISPDIKTISSNLSSFLKTALAIGIIAVDVVLSYKFTSDYLDSGEQLSLLADLLAAVFTAYTVSKLTGKIEIAGVALILSATASLTAIYDSVASDGFDNDVLVAAAETAIKTAMGGWLIAKATGVSAVAGALTGLTIALAIAAIVTVTAISANKRQNKADWGDLTATEDELTAFIEDELFPLDVSATITLIDATLEDEEAARTELETTRTTLQGYVEDLQQGIELDEEDLSNLKTDVETQVDNLQIWAQEAENVISLMTTLVSPVNTEGDDISDELLTSLGLSSELITNGATDIGNRISEAITEGLENGLTDELADTIAFYIDYLNKIEMGAEQALLQSEYSRKFESLSDLDRESMNTALELYKEYWEEAEEAYTEIVDQSYDDLVYQKALLQGFADMYQELGEDDTAETYLKQIEEIDKQLSEWDTEYSVQLQMESDFASVKSEFIETLQDAYTPYTEDLKLNAIYYADTIAQAIEYGSTDDVQSAIQSMIAMSMGGTDSEDYKTFVNAADYLGVAEWELLTSDVQYSMYQALAEAAGGSSMYSGLVALGYDMTKVIAEGLVQSGYEVLYDEAGNLAGAVKDGATYSFENTDFSSLMSVLDSLGIDVIDTLIGSANGTLDSDIDELLDTFGVGLSSFKDQLSDWSNLDSSTQMQLVWAIADAIGGDNAYSVLTGLGIDMSEMIMEGLCNSDMSFVTDEAGNLVVMYKEGVLATIGDETESIVSQFEELGYDMVDGMIVGIGDEMDDQIQLLCTIFGIPFEEAADVNETHSPSVLFEELGVNIVEGLIDGLETLSTAINGIWDELPESFKSILNVILSLFSSTDYSSAGEEAASELKSGLNSVDMPLLEAAIELIKSGWTSVSSWVDDTDSSNDTVTKTISLTLGSSIKSVASWLLTSSILGGDVDKTINLVKGEWFTLPTDSTVIYEIDLRKGWTGNLSNWISSSWSKTFTINLKKGNSITWSGTVSKLIDEIQVKFAAGGGTFRAGEMFIAREAGPELVGRIGHKSAVANETQIGDAIFRYMDAHGNNDGVNEESLASAIVRGLKSAGIGAVYLNGRNMANAINEETRRSGKSAIVF